MPQAHVPPELPLLLLAVERRPRPGVEHVPRVRVGVQLLLGLPVLDDVVRPRRGRHQHMAEQSALGRLLQLAQHARHGHECRQPTGERSQPVDP